MLLIAILAVGLIGLAVTINGRQQAKQIKAANQVSKIQYGRTQLDHMILVPNQSQIDSKAVRVETRF